MKFFTPTRDSQEAYEAYERHVESIQDRLAPALLKLRYPWALHDASLKTLTIDVSGRKLSLFLEGNDSDGGLLPISLEYLGLSSFRSVSSSERGHGGHLGYGDLLYHEIDLTEGRDFEHRILFRNEIEFEIRFADLSLPPDFKPVTVW